MTTASTAASTTADATRSPRRRRHLPRRIAALGAVLAIGVVLLSACEVPDPPAAKLFDAWKANDPASATGAFTTHAAKVQMFSEPYSSSAQWTFIVCDGAAGSTYCTWVNKIEGKLILRVDNASQQVTSVQRISLGNLAAGRAFHGWRVNSKSFSASYGYPGVFDTLFTKAYKASDHWVPQGCVTDSDWQNCTWTNDGAKTLVLRVESNTQFVDNISGTFVA